MFCKSCGKDIPAGVKFCAGCGTPVPVNAGTGASKGPNPTPTPTPNPGPDPKAAKKAPTKPAPTGPVGNGKKTINKQIKRKKTITLIIVLVVVLALLAVGGFIAFKIINDPAKKISSAISSGNPKKVASTYKGLSSSEKNAVNDDVVKYVSGAYDSYVVGDLEIEYDDMLDGITAIADAYKGDDEGKETIEDILSELEKVADSSAAYEKAVSLESKGDIAGAIAQYSKVVEADADNYKKAKSKISELESTYVSDAISKANIAISNDDFDSAKAILQEAVNALPNNSELLSALAGVDTKRDEGEAVSAISEMESYVDNGNYSYAYTIISDAYSRYPNNTIISDAYINFNDKCFEKIQSKVDSYMGYGDYPKAINEIDTAANYFGANNTTIVDMRASVMALYKFSYMTTINQLQYDKNDDAIRAIVKEMAGIFGKDDPDVSKMWIQYDVK